MESNLFKYILRHSWREQAIIVGIVLIAQIFYFASLDLPKTIVNEPIQGEGFEEVGATARFLVLAIPLPGFLDFLDADGTLRIFDGFDFERLPYLVALSLAFLLLVFINGGFKLQINTMKGRLGERMLRRLRYELFDRVLRFPLSHFRKVKQAEIATMVKDEVEPLGGFIGDAFVQPAFLGGQALTALAFILTQSLYLGLVTVGILVLQLAIIPPLRRPVLRLGKERQLTARQLSGRVAECVDGAAVIHTHDTSNYERADIADRLGRIFSIRFRLYQVKFAVKFLNNLLAQMTPFLFYLVGGYLAVTGRLDLGGLVATIAAYKDLPGPVKELLDWYQQLQDVQLKYEQVIEQFQPDGVIEAERQAPGQPAPPLTGDIVASGVALVEDGDRKLLDGVTFSVDSHAHVAVAGDGREALAMVLAGLARPTGGSLSIGGRVIAEMPEAVTGRRLAYVGADSYFFPLSVRDNLLYGLRHAPLKLPDYDDASRPGRQAAAAEARRAGNPDLDVQADWVDYAAAGASGPADIDERLIEALRIVELEADVYQFGLRGMMDPARRPHLARDILAARNALRERLADPSLSALVEPFDQSRYNKNMSLAENLLFGTAVGEQLRADRIAHNGYLQRVVADAGVAGALVSIGRQIAETMVELFADLPPGHPFFDQFSFIGAEDLPDFRALLGRIEKSGLDHLVGDDRGKLMALSLPYVEARHRLGLIDEAMEARLLEARRAFAANLPAALAGAIEFYHIERYNAAATLQDNVLFGRLVYGQAQAAERIGKLISDVLSGLELKHAVLEVGLDFQVGIAGKRLGAAQRQKLDLARALVKRPDVLILSDATTLLDPATQGRVMGNILAARRGQGVVCMLHRPSLARGFERALVMRAGRVVEQGAVADLDKPGTALHRLMASE